MIKSLRGWLLIMSLIAGLAGAFWIWTATPLWQYAAYLWGVSQGESIRSIAFELDRERWLTFEVAATPNEIKLMTNAIVPARAHELGKLVTSDNDPIYTYALEYKLQDSEGKMLAEGRHYHRSVILDTLDPDTGENRPTSWLEEGDRVVAATQPVRFDFGKGHRDFKLKLRLADIGSDVESVLARLYTRDLIQKDQLANRWTRLSREQQEGLAQSTIYPADLLSVAEKTNLMRNRWRPIGPSGLAGRDYASTNLFSRRGLEEDYVPDPILPAGLVIDRGRVGVVPVAPDVNLVELRFARIDAYGQKDAASVVAPPRPITLRWFGQEPGQRETRVIEDPQRPLKWVGSFEPGLVQVEVHEPMVVRVFDKTPGQVDGIERELTPETVYLRTYYSVGPDLPVEYIVDHIPGQPTPMRVDLRTSGSDAQSLSGSVAVQYHLLDESGGIIERGQMTTSPVISTYDRPVQTMRTGWVTEPTRSFFTLSEEVVAVRLLADSPVWAAAYTRPPDIPFRIDPDTHYARWVPIRDRLPNWFLTRPYVKSGRIDTWPSLLLAIQKRPPIDNPVIRAGIFDWSWIKPEGVWRGREILAPMLEGQPLRAEARSAVYRPLQPNLSHALQFAGDPGIPRVTPRVIFLRDQSTPETISISIDGEVVVEQAIRGQHGELRLPTLDIGPRRVTIVSSSGTQWMINYAGDAPGSFLQRTAQQITDETLRVRYVKQTAEEETLTLRLFMLPDDFLRIRVEIGAMAQIINAAMSDWTASVREFEVAGSSGVSALAALQKGETRVMVRDQRLYIVLGADMPPGEYPVTVTKLAGGESYAQFYRVLPGLQRQRDVFRYSTEQVF